MLAPEEFAAIRSAIASIPGDVSNDAVGNHAPKLREIYAPEIHAAALDPEIPIVVGSRGTGKSFWSGVLGQEATRSVADRAYPRLGLNKLAVGFGFTGAVAGPRAISVEHLNKLVKPRAGIAEAKAFWWATILLAASRAIGEEPKLSTLFKICSDMEERDALLLKHEERFAGEGVTALIVYDALDTVAHSWPRRRMLTEALFQVLWGMRAYTAVRIKVFLRPDQIDDDAIRFVELPKLRTGAVRLEWPGTDLYGLFFTRLLSTAIPEARDAFVHLLSDLGISSPKPDLIASGDWSLAKQPRQQEKVFEVLAGKYMADGLNAYKKGKTYEWPLNHLADVFNEVTPRSFLGLMIGASKRGAIPLDRAITPDGIRHGLREASRTRVDQLHSDFPWIKGVLAPLAGLLLPQDEKEVFRVWKRANTVNDLLIDAEKHAYLSPFLTNQPADELHLFEAMHRIGVMSRRNDGRIDMPDLFRVAAKLLKKGGTTPL